MWLISLLFFLFFPKSIYAQSQVKINDFCADCDPEWVDIKNTGTTEVQIDSWYLSDESGHKLPLSGSINIDEIKHYEHNKGWLNNDKDTIFLKNNSETIIDQLSYPIPTSTPTPTPEITPTPIPTETPIVTPTDIPPTSEPTITNTPTPLPTPISNLYINEIMPNPDTGSEWLEIFNDNDFDINLENYKIKDNTTHYRIISANTILAHSYYIFMFSNYLNNSDDSITLFDQYTQQIGETFSYTKTTKGYSYSLQEDNTWCLTTNSLNQDNNSCYLEPTTTPKPTDTPKPTLTPKNTPTPKPPKKSKAPKPTNTPKITYKQKQIISKSTGFIPPQISLLPTAEITSTAPIETPKSNLISFLFLGLGGIFLLAPLLIV